MDLVLIRHPAPAIAAGVCYGRTDVPLAGDAVQAAAAIAERLAALGTPTPQAFWTSPLVRCASIAAPLAGRFGQHAQADARLQEIDFGAWEGRCWDAIDRAALDAWAADLQHARVHGGENVAQFSERVGGWLDEWRTRATDGTTAHVITHAGVIRMLAALALDMPLDTLLARPLGMAALVWLQRENDTGRWQIRAWDV
jgi:alpha-ribazole phosphatase